MKWTVEPCVFELSVGDGQPGHDIITSEVIFTSIEVTGDNYFVKE